jgi:hypothetical protein
MHANHKAMPKQNNLELHARATLNYTFTAHFLLVYLFLSKQQLL